MNELVNQQSDSKYSEKVRRKWSTDQKEAILKEAERANISGVAKKYGLAPSQLFLWRKKLRNLVGSSYDKELAELRASLHDFRLSHEVGILLLEKAMSQLTDTQNPHRLAFQALHNAKKGICVLYKTQILRLERRIRLDQLREAENRKNQSAGKVA